MPGEIDRGVVAAILVALAVLMVTGGAVLLYTERAFSRRLRHFIGNSVGEVDRGTPAFVIRASPSLVQRANRAFARSQVHQAIRRELIRAGSPLHPGQFIYLRVLATVAGGLLPLLVLSHAPPLALSLLTLLGAGIGWLAPMAILHSMQRRRLAAFERHLPDAIDIMAGSLEAGSSLPMALELVAREIPAPVSTEFARCLREVGLGMSLDDALMAMLERIYSDELDLFATAVAIQFRVGGNLADVLRVIAHTIRERVRIRGDIRTLTAQQSISANILIMLPIALAGLLFLINPAYELRLLDPGFPQFASASAALMIVLAYFILKRIVNIDA
jgi:tight adherence protein B